MNEESFPFPSAGPFHSTEMAPEDERRRTMKSYLDLVNPEDTPGTIAACGQLRHGVGPPTWLNDVAHGSNEHVAQVLAAFSGDAYVRMTPTSRSDGGRGTADDAAALTVLWVDIDGEWGTHKKSHGLATDPEEVRTFLHGLTLPPSLVVNSGGGFYALWLIAPAFIIESADDLGLAKTLVKEWEVMIRRNAPFAIDATHDLARVLRIPGSVNFKGSPRSVFVEPGFALQKYEIGDLFSHLLEDRPKTAGPTPPTTPGTANLVPSPPPHAPKWLRDELSVEIQPGARSERFHMLVGRCRSEGYTLGHAVHILGQFAWATEKYAARLPLEVARSWAKVDGPDVRDDHSDDEGDESFKWPIPVPLELPPADVFPLDALAPALRIVVEAVATFTGTPPDLPAIAALGAVSATLTGRVRVIGPWIEHAHLFVALVAPPGARKTPVWNEMGRGLKARERELHQAWQEGAEERRALAKRLDQRIRRLLKDDDLDDGEAAREIAELEDQKSVLLRPPPRLVVEDVTPEALTSELARQAGRITAWSDEGGAIISSARGRYTKGDPLVEVFLKAYTSTEALIVSRQQRHIVIDVPAMTICCAMQPSVVSHTRADDELVARGLFSRFLFSWPTIEFGSRPTDALERPAEEIDGFSSLVQRLAVNVEAWPSGLPLDLSLDPVASEVLTHFRSAVELQMAQRVRLKGDGDPLLAPLAKMAGQVLRLAAVLHAASTELAPLNSRVISGDTMIQATQLGMYFISHAERVTPTGAKSASAVDLARSALRTIIDLITQTNPIAETFSQRELLRHNGRFGTIDELEPVLELLSTHGYIEPLKRDNTTAGAGRPSIRWVVNTKIVDWLKNARRAGRSIEWTNAAIDEIEDEEHDNG